MAVASPQKASSPSPLRASQKGTIFLWEAKTKQGEVRKGEMEAVDAEAVESRLRAIQLNPTKVQKKTFLHVDLKLPGINRVSGKDLLVFTRQFATMIDAGLPLVQCLEILGSQMDNAAFKSIVFSIKSKVEQGSTFADALKEHPTVFDELYVQLCAAGEVGGILDTILNRLAVYQEKSEKLKGRVKSAMTYPIVVVAVAVGVTALLLLKVTPTFSKMFSDFGGELPAPTQFVVDASEWLQQYYLHVLAGIAAFVSACAAFYRNPQGRRMVDRYSLRLPVVGDVIRKIAVARFTRTLGTMLSSGVSILEALEVTAKTAGNRTIEDGIYFVRTKISEGKNIAGPLAETKVFPSMVVQMIGVGEATGAMDTMLGKIADFYDEEVDAAIAGLTSLIEPVIMVFLGGMVGGFLIAMYLPIFSLAGAVQ